MDIGKKLREWASLEGIYKEYLTIKRVNLPAKPGTIPVGIEADCIVRVRVHHDGSEEIVAIKPAKHRGEPR
ncbi:MAG: hypothetical protein Q6370_020525 [Candidatus Sigynarchaeota archaeon]